MEEKYQEALNLYNQCDYEEAYAIIIDNGLCSTEKGDFLYNECKKQILQQYIYLVKDYVTQEMYGEAKGLRQYYYSQYGFSSELSNIVIPEPILQDETEEVFLPEQEPVEEPIKEDNAMKSKPNRVKIFFVWGIGFVLIGIISYFICVQSFKNENTNSSNLIVKKYSPNIESIKSDPNKLVLYINFAGNVVYYVEKRNGSFSNNIIYKYSDLDNMTYEISCENIKCTDNTEICIYSQFSEVIIKDGKILLEGWNGGSGVSEEHYVVRFYPEYETFKLLIATGFNEDIEYKENKFIVHKRDWLKLGDARVNDEYFYYSEYYNLDGDKLDGFSVSGEGKIDKYSIRLFFHSLEGVVTGWYRYKGHDNYMTIKGKLQNNQFVFTEYDDKGNAFATFKGDADFEKQLLVGTFHRDNKELNFWIYNGDDLRSCVEAWNYIHTPYLGDCANYTNLYGESVSFYGRTFTSEQCVEHFLSLINKYDSYSQKIVSEINYTSIDDNIIRCDFTKGVEFNGKYKEYEAYLVLHRRNEYSPWKIIVESDKTTDYNLNKTNR